VVHFYRDVWTAVPTGKVKEVAAMPKASHAQDDASAAKEKARQVVIKLREMRLARAADIVEAGIDETLSYYNLPPEHWRCLFRPYGGRVLVVAGESPRSNFMCMDTCSSWQARNISASSDR
jgi:hypothetical protein